MAHTLVDSVRGLERTSPHRIVQHAIFGFSRDGFIELLEVFDPPEGRRNFVIHLFNHKRNASFVVESSSLDSVSQMFSDLVYQIIPSLAWRLRDPVAALPLHRRRSDCTTSHAWEEYPWFYPNEETHEEIQP